MIVAAVRPHEKAVLEAISDLGLEHQVIFNRGAVMVLPSGVNEASGLAPALEEMDLSPRKNDHAFLSSCACAVAVADALPGLKEHCDHITAGEAGAGVTEIARALVDHDLARLEPGLARRHLLLGSGVEAATCRASMRKHRPPGSISPLPRKAIPGRGPGRCWRVGPQGGGHAPDGGRLPSSVPRGRRSAGALRPGTGERAPTRRELPGRLRGVSRAVHAAGLKPRVGGRNESWLLRRPDHGEGRPGVDRVT